MRHLHWIILILFSSSLSFAQPCNPGDSEGKPGCPSGDCSDNPKPTFSIPVLRASDPNEIIGRPGYDSLVRWVSVKQNLDYKVLFENDPDFATAPAQNVTIYVPIHEKLNPSSLRISDFGFGSFNFSVPPNTSVYTNRLDVRDSLGIFVDITAGLDIANRRAFWIFQSIDPATGLAATLPANSGFLPVNDSLKHNGEGYVTFTILPSSRSVTKDTTSARASIIFDLEETIATNLWKNTIDASAPSSHVKLLPAQSGSPTFNVEWEGQDDAGGSGIRDFDLYVSENNAPFSVYKTGLTGGSTPFTGTVGNNYRFYTLASDNVGNKEEPPANADAQITLGCVTPSLSITPVSSTLTCASPTASLLAVGVGSVRWSTGATTASISVSVAGTYSVTLTSATGCTATASVVVNANQAAPAVSISPLSATLTCASPIASLSAVGTGSARWSTGATTSTISVSVAGTYSVTLTSTNGCTATSSVVVGASQTAPVVSINPSSATLTCATPTVSLSAIGAGTLRWSTGVTTSSISASTAGTYSVTLTNANGCTATASTVVSQNAASVSISPSSATLGCATPTVSLSASGTGSVRWSTGATTSSISVSVAGTYSVTLTNATGCTATASVSVGANFTSLLQTVKNGSWNDPTTWSCGRVPVAGDIAVIQHVVTVPASYTGSALVIRYSSGGRLIYGAGGKIQLKN